MNPIEEIFDVPPRCTRIQASELTDGWRIVTTFEQGHANIAELLRAELP